jgi:hypothetical protein
MAIGAAFALCSRPLGATVLKVGAFVTILYAMAYLLLGGFEDAPGHIPGVVVLFSLALLTHYSFRTESVRHNKSLERTREE